MELASSGRETPCWSGLHNSSWCTELCTEFENRRRRLMKHKICYSMLSGQSMLALKKTCLNEGGGSMIDQDIA